MKFSNLNNFVQIYKFQHATNSGPVFLRTECTGIVLWSNND